MFFKFILIYSQLFYHGLQAASQQFGYIGCLPDSSFNDQHTSRILLNDGVYCIGFCKTSGFRYAATKYHICKCASNLTTSDLKGNDSCNYICPGRKSERCGGKRSVSLYDTLLQELGDYRKCVEDPLGLSALTGTNRYADDNNSATRCATNCNEMGYPLSGTKINLCICGDRLNPNITKSPKCEMKCPGNETETCGGDNSVSIRLTVDVTPNTTIQDMTTSSTKMTPSTTTQKTTTQITDTPKGTTMTSRPTRTTLHKGVLSTISSTPETSSQKDVTPNTTIQDMTTSSTKITPSTTTQKTTTQITDTPNTKGSPLTGPQMTAVYITLPGLIIVASSVVIIVWLILRHKRLVSEARDKRDEVASCDFTQTLERNITSDDKHIYDNICPDASLYDEDATQRNTAGKTYATDYLKPINSNGTPDYLTLIDSNDTGEYTIPEDPKDSNEYLTPGDPKDSNEYLTPEVPKDSNEYLTPGDPNYTTKYRTPVDPNYSDGYVIPVYSNDTTEYSVESKQFYDDVY